MPPTLTRAARTTLDTLWLLGVVARYAMDCAALPFAERRSPQRPMARITYLRGRRRAATGRSSRRAHR